jgi:hypothetical protein
VWLSVASDGWDVHLDGMSWQVVVERGGQRVRGAWTGRELAGLDPPVAVPDEVADALAEALDAREAELAAHLDRVLAECRAVVRVPMGSRAAVDLVRVKGRPELVVSLAGPLGDPNAPGPVRIIAKQWWSDVGAALRALGWTAIADGYGTGSGDSIGKVAPQRFVVLHHRGTPHPG